MTAIAGIVASDGTVLVGADSLGTYNDTGYTDNLPKVFRLVGGFAVAVCGDARVAQAVWAHFEPPKPADRLDMRYYMVAKFVEAYRAFAREHGLVIVKDGQESVTGRLLVGIRGHLFTVFGDFSISAHAEGFAAIGCAEGYVSGAIHALTAEGADRVIGDEKRILTLALEAAAHFDIHVRAPFHFVEAPAAWHNETNEPCFNVRPTTRGAAWGVELRTTKPEDGVEPTPCPDGYASRWQAFSYSYAFAYTG